MSTYSKSEEVLNSQLAKYRINQEEYNKICDLLGRPPKGIEWALFSALWSEHCSYKSSKVHLKKFFSKNDRVVESFGENAGVIELGQGEKIAFKMESHNHPSFIEPFQGAATGVGGILRDIFTMNARPIVLANYLCFGEPNAPKMKSLVKGVVGGISHYGNCVGVPTITGQVEFNSSYNENILVNAFALGLFRKGKKVVTSKASGVGNYVVYVGAKTGRDGIHGASMASESFDENSEAKRPTIQIGDPFFEKLLIESCLEVMDSGLVVAIQDMGAAGLTSSSFEMASKGGVGLKLELDKIPLRDTTMLPEDILLSESQERMLLVCEPSNFEKIKKIFTHWQLDASVVGEITSSNEVEIIWHGECLTKIHPDLLVENAPMYLRPFKKWNGVNRTSHFKSNYHDNNDLKDLLLKALKDPMGTSRLWVTQQYDQRVGAKTVRDTEDSVSIVRLPDSGRSLSTVLGCRPHVMRWDAEMGGMDSVAYPSIELAIKGFEPLAVTDCLNFGNPEKEETMTEFVAAVEAMSETCRQLNTPVISGNVSFYNETKNKNVTSTPSTGVVGIRNDVDGIPVSFFNDKNLNVYLIEQNHFEFSGLIGERIFNEDKPSGSVNPFPKSLKEFVKSLTFLTNSKQISATRIVGKFGLAYCLAKMCEKHNIGFILDQSFLDSINSKNKIQSLFGEVGYQIVIAVENSKNEDFFSYVQSQSGIFNAVYIGQTGGKNLVLDKNLEISLNEIKSCYNFGIEGIFNGL